jgi:starch-binding outer membrane protein, SusD/RagB family
MKRIRIPYLLLALCLSLAGCQEGFLDEKPVKSQVVPSSLNDLQALLDNTNIMNRGTSHNLGVVGSDDYFVSTEHWRLISLPEQRNAYRWAKDIFENQPSQDWDNAYQRVLYANTVLEGLEQISPATSAERVQYEQIKGAALFFRAWSFYSLAQLFSKPYDPATAAQDPGIPLRLSADVTAPASRQTVAQTYARIQEDLLLAHSLLPATPLVPQRPGKAAASFLLARLFLQVGDYPQALAQADATLALSAGLLDYNTLNPAARYPFPAKGVGNPEIIFHTWLVGQSILGPTRLQADTVLFRSYADQDLRKQAFFFLNAGIRTFKGSYDGADNLSSSFTTGEMYLTKAECLARLGQPEAALETLNLLLRKRFRTGTFSPLTGANTPEVLARVLQERRKELVLRGVRWEDLRRLNRDPRFAVTLARVLEGTRIELPPGDVRYTWPIPDNVTEAGGMPQNPR